ncbi:hypothetical protein [Streptomyces scabiei]|uniref:hypothetical protein n=1 Tax=Streptomyces scabiei TaxID=1930 RepID=UPI0029AC6B0C|nr:hypothetical protein [Streptomyces scabiei]MDX2794017.1 hypothetical protein [Streptomyces scabiei]
MTALERAREYFDRVDGTLMGTGSDWVQLVAAVGALLNAVEEQHAETGGMSRADALKLAREHVEAMSTNARGYQDGVKLSDKVQAMDAFARFLMGESE